MNWNCDKQHFRYILVEYELYPNDWRFKEIWEGVFPIGFMFEIIFWPKYVNHLKKSEINKRLNHCSIVSDKIQLEHTLNQKNNFFFCIHLSSLYFQQNSINEVEFSRTTLNWHISHFSTLNRILKQYRTPSCTFLPTNIPLIHPFYMLCCTLKTHK